MKIDFKAFFKKNWIILSLTGLGILLLILGVISTYIMVAGFFILSIVCFYLFAIFKAKYKKTKDVDPKKDYFDARELDYDESVYYVGEGQKKTQLKQSWSQFSTFSPMIIFALLGIMNISFGMALLFRYLI